MRTTTAMPGRRRRTSPGRATILYCGYYTTKLQGVSTKLQGVSKNKGISVSGSKHLKKSPKR